MLGSLLEKKLKELKGTTLLVVMDDGIAFAGKLVEFDKTTIVLHEVYQGSAMKISWGDVSSDNKEDIKETLRKGGKYGFVDWTSVALKELYISVDHVSRIWPWELKSKEERVETPLQSEPIYYKDQVEVNRAMGMDMPDSPF